MRALAMTLWLGCLAMIAWAGCSPETAPPAATGSCVGEPDGTCDMEEGCDCADCAATGYCVPGGCVEEDGYCDPDLDSCVCPDCDQDYLCGDPSDQNCTPDGECDPYNEGCNCVDCESHEQCIDNVMACDGATPDGICTAPTEDCACPDCLGTASCAPCTQDGECSYEESCQCADCAGDDFCVDPESCHDDDICAPMYEGCHCADCQGSC